MQNFFILRDAQRRKACIDWIAACDFAPLLGVRIEAYKQNRSLAQNNTYHMWKEIIAKETGNSLEDMHDLFRLKFLGMVEKTVMGTKIKTLRSTTSLTVDEFMLFMTKIEMLARQLNIILPYPDNYMDRR